MRDSSPCVIMLEFNELCPDLMNRFINAGILPNFARLRAESEIYVTDAEAEGEELNPWVQWVTAHTGVNHEEHQVMHLSQGHLLETKAIWDRLSDQGYKVWVCSSMNPRADLPLNGFLLPDPWSTGVRPQPEEEFKPFFEYVRSATQEYSKSGSKIGGAQFLKYMLRHGLSLGTAVAVAQQLFSERLKNVSWKRAAILDRLQFDLFKHYFRKYRPDFSTFFINSTAHFQHCYWRHMNPQAFGTEVDQQDCKDYGKAIEFGYRSMDRLVGKFMRLAPDNATLVFCTALSQQPDLSHEETGGRVYYRLKCEADLKNLLGLADEFRYEPVMANQFLLRFTDLASKQRAVASLESVRLSQADVFGNGNPQLFGITASDDEASIMCQCRATAVVDPDAKILLQPDVELSFHDVFYELPAVKSGRHHPDGMLWVRKDGGKHVTHSSKLPLVDVAALVLDVFGVQGPAEGIGNHV